MISFFIVLIYTTLFILLHISYSLICNLAYFSVCVVRHIILIWFMSLGLLLECFLAVSHVPLAVSLFGAVSSTLERQLEFSTFFSDRALVQWFRWYHVVLPSTWTAVGIALVGTLSPLIVPHPCKSPYYRPHPIAPLGSLLLDWNLEHKVSLARKLLCG